MVLFTLLWCENQHVELEFDTHCKRELVTISHLGGCVFFCPEKYLCLQCPFFLNDNVTSCIYRRRGRFSQQVILLTQPNR